MGGTSWAWAWAWGELWSSSLLSLSLSLFIVLFEFSKEKGHEMRIIVVPKTIDNDLTGTDHCPGYGSVIKYVATTVKEIALDNEAMGRGNLVMILEVMGRSAGWIAAGASLAKRRDHPHDPPHLIYLPDSRPTFFGHYWLEPEEDKSPVAPNFACLDYSVAAGGPLIAYRFDGEHNLSPNKYVWT